MCSVLKKTIHVFQKLGGGGGHVPPVPPGICTHGRTPPWGPPCLGQAPPGEMWADLTPCSTSGLERSTVAMVRLQVHHWVRIKTSGRLQNIFTTFLLQVDDFSTKKNIY